jgi:hypothetical protein
MTTGTHVQLEISTPEPLGPTSPGARLTGNQAPADHARAVQKVAEWREYMPKDCVDSMIKDGWRRTVWSSDAVDLSAEGLLKSLYSAWGECHFAIHFHE